MPKAKTRNLTRTEFEIAKEKLLANVGILSHAMQPLYERLNHRWDSCLPSAEEIKRVLLELIHGMKYHRVQYMSHSTGGLMVKIEKLEGRFVRASMGYVLDIPV